MTRQAQVGLFAIAALLVLFFAFYEITDFGTRHTGYRIGIHFESAAGLQSGAQVFFSGVTVGTVESVKLLDDNTVDVIAAINKEINIPRDSRFLIQAPLTGNPSLIIVPRRPPLHQSTGSTQPVPMLARDVLPIAQQPLGSNAPTLADLMEQGQGEVKRLDTMLADLQEREPRLLDTLQSALDNANALTVSMKSTVTSLSGELQSSLSAASANLVSLTGTLNDSAKLNSSKINDIVTNFDQISVALNRSTAQLQSLATDPSLKSNLLATTKNIADTTKNMADLTHDLQHVTGDPQTQAQLKNTVANLDATMQRANSLLGSLGGTSSVYGVDANASPYPVGTPLPGAVVVPGAAPAPAATFAPRRAGALDLHNRLSSIATNLVRIDFSLHELSPQAVCCPSPLFSADRGPQSDVNAVILPHGSTKVLVGAENIGANTTTDAALIKEMTPKLDLGGGVLYSRLGLLGAYHDGIFGVDAKVYDARRPEVDLYGNVHLFRQLDLFAGERAINHAERRFDYGLKASIP